MRPGPQRGVCMGVVAVVPPEVALSPVLRGAGHIVTAAWSLRQLAWLQQDAEVCDLTDFGIPNVAWPMQARDSASSGDGVHKARKGKRPRTHGGKGSTGTSAGHPRGPRHHSILRSLQVRHCRSQSP